MVITCTNFDKFIQLQVSSFTIGCRIQMESEHCFCTISCLVIDCSSQVFFAATNSGVEAAHLAMAKAALIRQMTEPVGSVTDAVCFLNFGLCSKRFLKKPV